MQRKPRSSGKVLCRPVSILVFLLTSLFAKLTVYEQPPVRRKPCIDGLACNGTLRADLLPGVLQCGVKCLPSLYWDLLLKHDSLMMKHNDGIYCASTSKTFSISHLLRGDSHQVLTSEHPSSPNSCSPQHYESFDLTLLIRLQDLLRQQPLTSKHDQL